MLHRFLFLLTGLTLGSGLIVPKANAQVAIFNASPSAQAGEAISVQGNFSATAKVYGAPGSSTSGTVLPVQVQSAGQASVQVPAALGQEVFQVWVEDSGQRSPAVFVNRAWGMHFDTPEVTPGGALRIFGRNLQLSGSAPQVRFAAQNGSGSATAVVNTSQSNSYKLTVTTPTTLQPGTTYDVFVSNGRGGSAGETKVDQVVKAVASGTDYFQLGVGWAAKLNFYNNVYNVRSDSRLTLKATGDGVANDQPAIQAAIDKASAAGGGIVYLPAGTFKLVYNGIGLNMRSRVVLQGAGKGQTFIKFGYGTFSNDKWGLMWSSTTQAGLADLTIQNVNESTNWINNMTGSGTEVFMQRINFDLSTGDWLWWANSNKMVIANSDFKQGIDSKSGYHGPVQLNGCTNFVIARNNFTYAVDGLNLNSAHEGVFEDNNVYRDGSARYPTTVVNHVLVMNFAENVAVLNNLFKVINGPAQNSNDGETIIAEGGAGDRPDEEAGTVTAATASTLQDNTKSWGVSRKKPVVAIINGKGMGQWRTITSRSGNTLNLDRPWDVVPTAGSRYAIFNWGARNWLIQGNNLEGNRRGVTLYHNATHQVAIVNNTLTNSGSIDLTPVQQQMSYGQQFVPMYTNQIVGNTVSNTDGSNGVFIGVHTVQYVQERTLGTSVIGLEVRRNTLRAHTPNTPAIVDAVFPEGYLNNLQFQVGGTNYVDEQIPAVLGSIFQDNTAINCNNAFYLNTGSYNTLICGTQLTNSPNLISDERFTGVNHGSVRTVTCTAPTSPVTNPTGSTQTEYRINAGGESLSTSVGSFVADQNFAPTPGLTYSTPSAIAGTTDDALYQTEHYGTNGIFAYALPIVNGTYKVVLHFAELYWTSAGQRVFDVSAENAKVLTAYDIVAKAGGALTAKTETFTVNVTDGTLNLDFSSLNTGGKDSPKVSAIEVLASSTTANAAPVVAVPSPDQTATVGVAYSYSFPAGTFADANNDALAYVAAQQGGAALPAWLSFNATTRTFSGTPLAAATYTLQVTASDGKGGQVTDTFLLTANAPASTPGTQSSYRINAGGGALSTSLGSFTADQNFAPSSASVYSTTAAIAGTSDDALYQTERYSASGAFGYALPVASGTYTVVLHFAELYWNSAGQRVFDVSAENTKVLTAYDIVAKAGGALTAKTETFTVNVTDGTLNLDFSSLNTGGKDSPKVSAIEVRSGSPTTTPSPTGQSVVSFTLMNADTDQPIRELAPGEQLNLSMLPTRNLNIRANTSPVTVGSVKFVLSGAASRTQVETAAPYALFADVSGNYNPWTPAVGSYTLVGTPFTMGNASGTAGTPLSLSFTVTDMAVRLVASQMATSSPATSTLMAGVYPNPTSDVLNVPVPEGGAMLTVYSLAGSKLLQQKATATHATLNVQNLPVGTYLLVIQSGSGASSKHRFVKR
ncbi:Por secretion system C-terminal sorting domain-containing protein [Hymenobacter gelipurpurascens]|uniref:Por secretion system C-terminal sorting domain-containing protein n=1 Tax=Hymenobacter gelipurpurascens TaxID=89968 RepID=A0A212UH14_9BACT|nr:malectin domain-containing carbohydrate-binding protein [Hymenobacter gelipurpurascens]SNC77537.1 Por secretion system C-terminal sorting domain-containing protein [Hymenobacter gelipurpurascens]